MFGPDVPASVTSGEMRQLVEGVRFIERMRANPVDKDSAAAAMSSMRGLFNKSLVFRADLAEGTVLREEHLAAKKPGTGISPSRLQEFLGRRLRRRRSADEQLQEEDLEEARR
jgi:N-acetylneuraminate synthase